MKKIVTSFALIATLIGASSCGDFLDVQPVRNVSDVDLANTTGIGMLTTEMYAKLFTTSYFEAPLTNYVYGDVQGGQANKGSALSDQPTFVAFETFTVTLDNSYLASKWSNSYNGIFRANNLIKVAMMAEEELKATQGEAKDVYTETVAQARFIRALFHFELVKLYGAAVPYVDDAALIANVNPQVANHDEGGGYVYIWDNIISDLKLAVADLPSDWSNTGQYSKVNKWAAQALLAKVLIYQASPYNGANGAGKTANWSEAVTLLKDIVDNGTDSQGTKYKLADNYNQLFTAGESDWTGESVFDIQASISGAQTNTNAINGAPHIAPRNGLASGGWDFYRPSYYMANSFIVTDDGLPKLDGSFKNDKTLTKLDGTNITTDLNVYTDPRIDVVMGRFDVPYLDYGFPTPEWNREVTNGGPYFNKKNIGTYAQQGSLSVAGAAASSAKNYHYIRYADVLLLYAEALIETGDFATAGDVINQIRTRASKYYLHAAEIPARGTIVEISSSYVLDDKVGGTTGTDAAANYRIGLYPASQFDSKEKATQALRFERSLELALEGHRWYDLVRWGGNVASQELTGYKNYEGQFLAKYITANDYNPNWVMMPVPATQIVTMQGLLIQNEVWK